MAKVTIYEEELYAETMNASKAGRRRIAEQIASEARVAAPVVTGAYRGGISVAESGWDVGVVDSDPLTFYKEYGTIDTPAHAALTNAARRHGKYTGYTPRR